MKNIATVFALLLSMFLVGCAENPIASNNVEQNMEMKNVRVQMTYDGKPTQWQATFHMVDMGCDMVYRKPNDDTASFDLRNYHKGATIRIMFDTTLNVRQVNNFLRIQYIIGKDTVNVRGVEGLYSVITVN